MLSSYVLSAPSGLLIYDVFALV